MPTVLYFPKREVHATTSWHLAVLALITIGPIALVGLSIHMAHRPIKAAESSVECTATNFVPSCATSNSGRIPIGRFLYVLPTEIAPWE